MASIRVVTWREVVHVLVFFVAAEVCGPIDVVTVVDSRGVGLPRSLRSSVMADDGLSVFKVSGLAVGGAAAIRFIDAIRLEVRVPNSGSRGFELLRSHSVSDEDDSRCIWEGLLTIGGVAFIVFNL